MEEEENLIVVCLADYASYLNSLLHVTTLVHSTTPPYRSMSLGGWIIDEVGLRKLFKGTTLDYHKDCLKAVRATKTQRTKRCDPCQLPILITDVL
jgi:hypothetical protein